MILRKTHKTNVLTVRQLISRSTHALQKDFAVPMAEMFLM